MSQVVMILCVALASTAEARRIECTPLKSTMSSVGKNVATGEFGGRAEVSNSDPRPSRFDLDVRAISVTPEVIVGMPARAEPNASYISDDEVKLLFSVQGGFALKGFFSIDLRKMTFEMLIPHHLGPDAKTTAATVTRQTGRCSWLN